MFAVSDNKMSVRDFFEARTFVVIGANREEHKVGHAVFANLSRNGRIMVFPVNPNASEILGKKCYKDIGEIPYSVTCAVIAVRAELVPDVLRQCGKKGIKCAIVISAGFSESGNPELEEEIVEIAREFGISLLGPNILGLINPAKEINASFFEGIPSRGGIAFLSQSGALGVGVLDKAIKEKIGMSGFVSLGNCSQLDFSDFIEYYSGDRDTRVICMYVEGLKAGRGRRFIETCKKCRKPILALKSGKTSSGISAAKSHTAALASEEGVYSSMFREAGVIEVDSISEVLDLARVIDKYGELGKRACIVTNAGGLGVLASDACSEAGLEIVQVPQEVQEKLDKVLPIEASKRNPVDILGDALAERYKEVLKILDSEKFFDFFIVLLTPQFMTQNLETAQILASLRKPVLSCFYGGGKVIHAKKFFHDSGIINFSDVYDLRVLGKII